MAKTVIHDEAGQSFFGDEDFLKASQERSFTAMIFELLSGRGASSEELSLFELILNLSIDHGPETPSAKAVIQASQEEQTLPEAVAKGVEQINDSHGGAIEPAMEILYKFKSGQLKIDEFVRDAILSNIKIAGLGHRIYKDKDPRAELILEEVKTLEGAEEFLNTEREIQSEFQKQSGKYLVINVDGAIAVALCAMNWEARLSKAVFIIARTPGLCGQFLNATR